MDSEPESLFQRVQNGDQSARDELFAIVYDELRSIAHRRLGRRSERCTMNTTAVVDEAYIKLREANPSWNDREHFLRFAGAAMRAIVIDHVRSKGRLKRCGPGRRLELDAVVDGLEQRATASLVDLDVALERPHSASRRARPSAGGTPAAPG
jgi:RNA polymerase sigma factor (TIGR02999 family)